MSIINVLDFKTANLIAAGEVVERPASVVKELVENSIDAGASKITVEIKNGGVSMIKITDDGCGMSEDDLPRCVLRHATSKIATGDDLAAISTLGFRGEALAATAAVSRMKIVSKRRQDGTAHQINVNYGVCSTVTECGAPDGTTVTVNELFSNVPARRKFLKADKTEAAAVASVCEKLALSSLDVSLTLISDGVRRFQTAGDGELKNAVYALFGRQYAQGLIPVSGVSEGICVSGAVASPVLCRPNRAMELFFINGRYIRSSVISSALEQALSSFIASDRFPMAVVYITLHPSVVDVNVHPSKLEVKFSSDKPVFDAVYYAVRSSTEAGIRPELDPSRLSCKKPETVSPFIPVTDKAEQPKIEQVTAFDAQPKPKPFVLPEQETAEYTGADKVASPEFSQCDESADPAPSEVPGFFIKPSSPLKDAQIEEETPQISPKEWKFIGEAFDTYLFVEEGDDVLIIDKHALHERLNFEELKAAMKSRFRTSQMRMIPITVKVTPEEAEASRQYKEELCAAGYGYAESDGVVEITETPANFDDKEASDLFIDMLAKLAGGEGNPEVSKEIVFERALYQVCCKGAIKANDKNDKAALLSLIERMYMHPDITYCPHGRPVAFRMSRAALERRFGRT